MALDELEKAYNRLEQALLIVQSELDKEANHIDSDIILAIENYKKFNL